MRSRFIKKTISIALLLTTLTASVFNTFSITTAYAENNSIAEDSSLSAWPEAPEVSAGNAILIDADTGTCLYSKNPNTKMYPASTTKIMTAILVIENGNLDDIVTTSSQAISGIPARICYK